MSHARKHIKESLSQALEEIEPHQRIAKVVSIRGSNICEVEYPSGDQTLILIPSKFRNVVWLKGVDIL